MTKTAPSPAGEWIWDGYLAPGKVTLLSSRRSSGKSTLLSILLAKLKTGGELAGAAVKPARAFVLTRESRDLWTSRHRRFRYPDSIQWYFDPFHSIPSLPKWHGFVDGLCEHEFDLLVIDPLKMVVPRHVEHTDDSILAALQPLRRVTERGAAVIMLNLAPSRSSYFDYLRPMRKELLTDFADIAMNWDRPRTVRSPSRLRQLSVKAKGSPRRVRILELNEQGTDYRLIPERAMPDQFDDAWPIMKSLLAAAPLGLTRLEIMARWPATDGKPSLPSLRRWLARAMAQGLIFGRGLGRHCNPFVYGLLPC